MKMNGRKTDGHFQSWLQFHVCKFKGHAYCKKYDFVYMLGFYASMLEAYRSSNVSKQACESFKYSGWLIIKGGKGVLYQTETLLQTENSRR